MPESAKVPALITIALTIPNDSVTVPPVMPPKASMTDQVMLLNTLARTRSSLCTKLGIKAERAGSKTADKLKCNTVIR